MASIIIMSGTCPRCITMTKLAIITTVDPARTFSDLYLLLCKHQEPGSQKLSPISGWGEFSTFKGKNSHVREPA